jgi:hypothetical protein
MPFPRPKPRGEDESSKPWVLSVVSEEEVKQELPG